VPQGAAILLDLIAQVETSRDVPERYEVIYGHNQDKLPKPLTQMTLDEVEAAQPGWTKRFGSSAAGAYQFMRNTLDAPRTLRDIEGEMGLTGAEMFDADLQDLMGFHLLKRRGYYEFIVGKLSATQFGNRLAMEWASFPVLSAIKGAHRRLKRGQSFYAGDGTNKSLTKPEEVEAVLARVLATRAPQPSPEQAVPEEAPFPTKGAMDNEVVAQVQRRLKELGYTEIGNVDGDFGDFTEKAIIIFRHDAGLPLNGAIDADLIVALAQAQPRSLPVARQEATREEVREKVPEAKANWWTKVAGFWASVSAAVIAFFNWLAGSVGEVRQRVQPIADLFGAIPIWAYALIFIAGGVWLYLNGRKGEQASVEAVQEGARR
jgi:peptidoglycan hydrolase-like protein with peptidoglycan-binding domain/muramidase (phage lysozyme)